MINMDIVVMCLILFTFNLFIISLWNWWKCCCYLCRQHFISTCSYISLRTITSEKEYGLHITERGKKTCLSLHHNRISIFGTLMVQESVTSKQKIKWINTCLLHLGNVLKHFTVDNMRKKSELNGYVCEVFVSYDAINANEVLNFHKNVKARHNIK